MSNMLTPEQLSITITNPGKKYVCFISQNLKERNVMILNFILYNN